MSSIGYRKDIDALRGLSVLLVVIYHAFNPLLPGGFVGVDVFFVISGYLITSIIISEIDSRTFSFYKFYSRRIKRIFPALFLVLAAVLTAGWLVLFPGEYAKLGQHVFNSTIFIQNFNLIKEIGYFDTASHYKPLLHLWTLSIEEQYYVIWPALIVLLTRFRLDKSLYLFLIILPSFLLAVSLIKEWPDYVFFNSVTRFWELALGSWLAVVLPPSQKITQNNKLRYAGLITGISLIIMSAILVDGESGYPAWPALFPVFGALLIIMVNVQLPNWCGFVQLGLISYPLYLWHWAILSFCQIYIGERPPYTIILIAILISIILSYLTYRYIERVRYARSMIATIALIAAAAVIGLCGYYIDSSDGMPDRPQIEFVKQHQEQFQRLPPADQSCIYYVNQVLGRRPLFPYCRITNISRNDKRIAVIGDSHAHVLFPGMAEIAASHGYGAVLFAGSACPVLKDFMTGSTKGRIRGCQLITKQILEIIKRDTAIKKIIFTSRGPRYIHGEIRAKITEESVERSLSSYLDRERLNHKTFAHGLRETISLIEKLSHIEKIYYFTENPELDFHPKETLPRPFDIWRISTHSTKIDRKLYSKRMRRYMQIVNETAAEFDDLTIIDVEPFLCKGLRCMIKNDGKFLYADDHHLSIFGSRFIAGQAEEIVFNTGE